MTYRAPCKCSYLLNVIFKLFAALAISVLCQNYTVASTCKPFINEMKINFLSLIVNDVLFDLCPIISVCTAYKSSTYSDSSSAYYSPSGHVPAVVDFSRRALDRDSVV